MNAVMPAVMCLKIDNEQQAELKKGLLRIIRLEADAVNTRLQLIH